MVIGRSTVPLRTPLLSMLVLCVTLVVAGALSSLAWAGSTHKYTGISFGPTGTGSGSFSEVAGVTVEQSTGDVLVYDGGEGGRIYKFNSAGEPVDFAATATNVITGVGAGGGGTSEVAVDDSVGPAAGDIYAAHFGEVRIFSSTGASLGELAGEGMCGVAVDPSGNVYVGDYPETVRKYAPVMNPVTDGEEVASMSGLRSVCNVAADSEGNVYAADYYGGITRYDAGQFGLSSASGTSIDPLGKTLTVDPSTKDLYVNSESQIEQFGSGGEPLGLSGNVGMSGSFGVGVQVGGARLYIPEAGRIDVFGGGETVPDVTVRSSEIHVTTAVLKGTVNPDGLPVTSCEFEYGPEGQEGFSGRVPCSSVPGSGSTPVQVSAAVGGLESDSAYHYRLVAGNANGSNRTVPVSFQTLGPRFISSSYTSIGTRSATFLASVNPNREPTTVAIEYGTTTAYGASTTPFSVGSGNEALQVTVPLEGLQPETTYHARAVANNASGTVAGSDISFTTYALADLDLPDDRIYEKVSPNNNADSNVYNGAPADVAFEGFSTELPFVAAADGNSFTYPAGPSEKGGIGIEGGGAGNQYLATRAPGGGWSAHNITPYSDRIANLPEYVGFSENLSDGFFTDRKRQPLITGAPAGGYQILYENGFGTETLQSTLTVTPPHRTVKEFQVQYAGSSADLKHVLYAANDTLAQPSLDPGGTPEEPSYNLFDDHEGTLVPVNVLPDGAPEPNAFFGGEPLPNPQYFGLTEQPDLPHDISEDGRRIFWTAGSTHDLYMREDNEHTVQIDASVGGGAEFWDAAPDGSKVLFSKGGHLYEYDVASAQSTELTGGEVVNVVATSDDLSYVYFLAAAAVAPGAEAQTCENGGYCNMYALHSGEPVRFVAKISYRDRGAVPENETRPAGVWTDGLEGKEAQATPDGTHLVFGTVMSLTDYQAGGREEIYMYDYASSHISCLSCDPTGAGPQASLGAYLPVSNLPTHLPRWMSQDGDRVFFNSSQPLVAQDTNGAYDVYEWERSGTEGCTKGEGCVYMLSGGTAVEGSFLDEASANGNDVFIGTREALVSEDENENVDIYDVRAHSVPSPAPPQCTGTGCQGLPSAPPVFATPSSVTYNGIGNFPVAPKAGAKVKKPKSRAKSKKKKSKDKSKKKVGKGKGKGRKATATHKSNGRGK